MVSSSSPSAPDAGQYAGSSSDIRTILHYRIVPEKIGRLLPPGWEQRPSTSGHAAQANLRVTFVVPLSGNDANGKPYPDIRYVIFSIPAAPPASKATNRLMLLTGLTNGGKGPYGTNVNAKDDIRFGTHLQGPLSVCEESWNFSGDDGSSVAFQIEYSRGAVTPTDNESRVFSSVHPEFSRIYRSHEGIDVVSGEGAAPNRVRKFSFSARGEIFSQIFDGSERLVSVIALPWYNRKIYLPAS